MSKELTNFSYGAGKAHQLLSSFTTGNSERVNFYKSLGYSEDEYNSIIVLNDETVDGLIKGKLNTSKLVLKQVSVGGKMMNRWVDPNKGDKEHAQHGSDVEFSHKGKNMKGKVGSVTKTGEYAIRGSDGKTYNKHAHQFASPHEEKKVRDHADSESTEKLQEYVDKKDADPKVKKIAEEELKAREDGDDETVEKDINKKFKTYEKFVRMTARGSTKSTIAYGGGGVGKTYTATQQLKNMNNPETGKPFVFYDPKIHTVGSDDYDVVKITGKATTAGLYKTMYQQNGKLLIFDDCDEVLKNGDSVNMFKGALDSTGDGKIDNLSGRAIKDDNGDPIPQTYTFSGRAIFISNLESHQMPQALKSRSLRIDLSMDAQQTIDRIKGIAKSKDGTSTNIGLEDASGKKIKYDSEDMDKAIEFMDKYKNKMGDINVRTLGNLVKIIRDSRVDAAEGGDDEDEMDWEDTAKHFVFSKGMINSLVTKTEIKKSFTTLLGSK